MKKLKIIVVSKDGKISKSQLGKDIDALSSLAKFMSGNGGRKKGANDEAS